ncbi:MULTISPECIES: sensor histidine kinase [Streptomyces]|uniref:Histidine kinase n=1 Tax=Streptomyces doudnae TaxID=3075536 RepID=A0ABD5EKY8_9ACTN|nr:MULTISPECIES: histidine kinase [unclassified Streptomyces]MDT0434510.1 histidine kinase [Streptomyces sp. DSM 41981]MYQ66409.1 sensor histidine kinase [Streptomyces sp. SID4950]SCE19929.1 two-component system, NarL family, sensor histidine kinase DesK [Streptomyces sp. SolWspMP-5a-2]
MTDDPRSDEEIRVNRLVRIGEAPRNRRELVTKLVWVVPWLVFLASPFHDLLTGHDSAAVTAAGAAGLAAFVVIYLTIVFRNMGRPFSTATVICLVAVLEVLAVVLGATLGGDWLGLFVYVSVCCGITFPIRLAHWCIPVNTAALLLVGLVAGQEDAWGLFLVVLMVGYSMSGVRQLINTTVELRKARATVAQLAANEERLRMARDLHDLLGHSLSLITLKSELAGRMLPDHPEQAARQVTDIEQVSRQALVDVREAVTGYRRARLADELVGTQVALTAAGVTPRFPAGPDLTGVPEESESALAWALREAVTNVVRHSGARRCTVELLRRQTLDGPVLELTVEDDGSGGSGDGPGNGLTGLTERLAAAGGTLEAGRSASGFRLVARVPADRPAHVGSGA